MALGCPFLAFSFRAPGRPRLHRVLRFLRRHRVDVMLAEFAGSGWRVCRICQKGKIKLYVHVHGYDVSVYRGKPEWRRRYQELFKHAAGFIAPSRFLADELASLGCPREKLHVSPNGVDPRQFTPVAGEPLRLLAVGRLVEKKAPRITIAAFADVLKKFPGARLDMIGDGPLREDCLALIEERGLSRAVNLPGTQSHEQVVEAMRRASMFVQHSVTAANGDTEGFPVSILEAMASGLPVVATRHSGIPEAVIDGTTGILVAENDVSGMAQAIASFLADPAKADAMGAAGRRRVLAHFTETHTRDRLRAIMGLSLPWRLRNTLYRYINPDWYSRRSGPSDR